MRMKNYRAFSLIEVVLSLGLIAFVLVAIFALIPVGLNAGRDSVDATRFSLMAQDIRSRVQAAANPTVFLGPTEPALEYFYNRDGLFVDVSANGYDSVLYRAETIIHSSWLSTPPATDISILRPVTVTIGWPVNPVTHLPLGTKVQSLTFYVRRP